jgi:hypothetical protein
MQKLADKLARRSDADIRKKLPALFLLQPVALPQGTGYAQFTFTVHLWTAGGSNDLDSSCF